MNSSLEVHLRGKAVANLVRIDGTQMQLSYRSTARDSIDELSIALPVNEHPYDDIACRTFLDWLLPEKQVRNNIAARIHADASDTFSLVSEYGRECAGAIQFVHPGTPMSDPSVKWLTEKEFAAKVGELSTHPFLSLDEDDIDLSLGGVQEKALVVIDNDRIGLPVHGAISTHIVKPDISDRIRSVLAEYFAMRLARAVNISVADVEIRTVGGRWILFVRRFDRLVDATGFLRREHQETFAQACSVSPAAKYELHGGPGVGDLANIIRNSSADVVRDLQKLTALILFNAIIGNADAHAGNFGLIHYGNGAKRLAPAYDLIPVGAMLGRNPKGFAMRMGGTFEFGKLTDERVRALGSELGISQSGAVRIWRNLAERVSGSVRELAREVLASHTLSAADEERVAVIVKDIAARC